MCNPDRMFTKTIVRTQYLQELWIHASKLSQIGLQITSDGRPIIEKENCFQSINEDVLQKSVLHCNHYPIQSYDWFRRIKMTRGSAAMARNDKVRTIDYYNSFDSHSNQMVDDELVLKRGQLRISYGSGSGSGSGIYRDVTTNVYQHFLNRTRDKIIIDKSIVFNNYFGDPVPGQVKYLIVRQDNSLKIYPEKHETIIINM
jgi:hypothetical protein